MSEALRVFSFAFVKRSSFAAALARCTYLDTRCYPFSLLPSIPPKYYWAVAQLGSFSGDQIMIECISVQSTSDAIHPTLATWQCECERGINYFLHV